MTIVPPRTGAKVLVTGANGYIALHVVDQLLKAGYVVRGTVRSQSKVAHLTKTFASYGDKFECIVVEDITKVRPSIYLTSFVPCLRQTPPRTVLLMR